MDIYEAPIKTQVTLDMLIEEMKMDEQKIKDLLNQHHDKTIKRSGFKYHVLPSNIYAYTSKDKAESGMGQWVRMISKNHDDTKSKIDISETQLNSLTETAEDR